jgi:hypothetical protein
MVFLRRRGCVGCPEDLRMVGGKEAFGGREDFLVQFFSRP